MAAYYNEFDPFAAAWLRALIADGRIAPGEVDERSIKEVQPDDLKGFTQCHFFAGIGGWSYALRLAGWRDDRPVWTGSCPCQPFSAIGQRKGKEDPRHLWPDLRRLIADCAPPIVFGEQVASSDGRLWLCDLRSDLEALGFALGAADLCAAGIGANHIRQRLYWVANANLPNQDGRPSGWEQPLCDLGAAKVRWEDQPRPDPVADGVSSRMDKVRGGGNAIVPQLAAEFIAAAGEAIMSLQPGRNA